MLGMTCVPHCVDDILPVRWLTVSLFPVLSSHTLLLSHSWFPSALHVYLEWLFPWCAHPVSGTVSLKSPVSVQGVIASPSLLSFALGNFSLPRWCYSGRRLFLSCLSWNILVNIFQGWVLTHNNTPETTARKIDRPSLLSASLYPSLKTVNEEVKFKANTEKKKTPQSRTPQLSFLSVKL